MAHGVLPVGKAVSFITVNLALAAGTAHGWA